MTEDISFSSNLDESELAKELQSALRETVFSSGLNISPKRLNEIARYIARSFFVYFADQDILSVLRLGEMLADNGLAPKSVVSLTDKLRGSAANGSNPAATLPEAATSFCAALLIGFMEAREKIILREAERTHRAYLAALGVQ